MVCKEVSSDQVQTTLRLDPASKAEVNSAVSAGWVGGTKERQIAMVVSTTLAQPYCAYPSLPVTCEHCCKIY